MLKGELEAQLESYTTTDIGSSGDQDTHVLELKLKALILDTIHFIDVVDQLQHDNVRGTEEWAWQKQLRFYMDKKGNFTKDKTSKKFTLVVDLNRFFHVFVF